jgi:hypothetical protein
VASRLAIAVQRGSETTAANRSSSSTKIGCPYPLMIRLAVAANAPLWPSNRRSRRRTTGLSVEW